MTFAITPREQPLIFYIPYITITRMHSSMMRTVRNSSNLLGRGGCLLGVFAGTEPNTPHAVDSMTDMCKNITFPQLRFRTVNKHLQYSTKNPFT